MSTIQQIKNFIRHGKQARAANDDLSRAKQDKHHHSSTRAATTEPTQSLKQKKIPTDSIAKIVAEENAKKSKFPHYPGLERWELIEKMGDGAFSNVYRAQDREGDYGQVAIKVVRKFEMSSQQNDNLLHPDFKAKAPKAVERANILKEVQIMRQLDHPNIIKLIDFSESRQYYYIILELAPGGELFHQIVRLTYFSEELARHVITQVAKALEYLHEERGIVHRDIKPENILFYPIPFIPSKHPRPTQPGDEDKVDEGEFIKGVGGGGIGQIKIADFGLSKVIWENQTMTPCGTVGYTAPEIVKDERYSKSVDMWALGCVLYTLLCGFPPFYDESIEALTEKVAKGQYTFLSPWWDDISSSAKDLISHLLCVDPDKRYTIKEFLAHPWIRESGPTPHEEKKPTPTPEVALPPEMTKIVEGDRRYDFRSPAAVNLREIFDVGYAVHRQEEESKRRKHLGGLSRLSEVDEDVEMEEGISKMEGQQPHNGTHQLEERMRDTQISDSQQQRGRDREKKAYVPPAAQASSPVEQRGYGQHSAAVAAAARKHIRETQKQKGVFELNLEGATLLGRRGMKPATAQAQTQKVA